MADSKTVSFRVDPELWGDFQNWSESQGSNASRMIKNFMELCLNGGLDEDSVLAAALNPPDIDPEIEKAIANAIRPLVQRIETLEQTAKINKGRK